MLYVFIVVLCVIILYPYFVMFITALKDKKEMYEIGHILPEVWRWSNFSDIWTAAPVFKYLTNSMVIAGGATLLAILCGIPAAYALARMRFKGKGIFMGAVIMSQMFSPVVLLVGIYRMMVNINLNDTILGLILLNAAFNQAFAIWLLRGTFMGISPEMEQAAKIDGCGTVKALIKVLLPMAAPGIITTLIFVFINAWNEFLYALILTSSSSITTLSIKLHTMQGADVLNWGDMMAACMVVVLPSVVFFSFIQKYIAGGMTEGAVK